ncbi:MAG: EscU/YscU/HrcU family type III secretion system export apparatus switch protein [Deltaproteobacteria bacterium]|nr:EscU/YscU/HrcU family type III secretion system export apparatus switch protein [Deltaproteobacteria bacterium]
MKGRPSRHERAVGIVYGEQCGETPSISISSEKSEADEVVRIARRFGIPVVENASLARSLSPLDLDSQIPPSLFRAVAIVLAHLDRPQRS